MGGRGGGRGGGGGGAAVATPAAAQTAPTPAAAATVAAAAPIAGGARTAAAKLNARQVQALQQAQQTGKFSPNVSRILNQFAKNSGGQTPKGKRTDVQMAQDVNDALAAYRSL